MTKSSFKGYGQIDYLDVLIYVMVAVFVINIAFFAWKAVQFAYACCCNREKKQEPSINTTGIDTVQDDYRNEGDLSCGSNDCNANRVAGYGNLELSPAPESSDKKNEAITCIDHKPSPESITQTPYSAEPKSMFEAIEQNASCTTKYKEAKNTPNVTPEKEGSSLNNNVNLATTFHHRISGSKRSLDIVGQSKLKRSKIMPIDVEYVPVRLGTGEEALAVIPQPVQPSGVEKLVLVVRKGTQGNKVFELVEESLIRGPVAFSSTSDTGTLEKQKHNEDSMHEDPFVEDKEGGKLQGLIHDMEVEIKPKETQALSVKDTQDEGIEEEEELDGDEKESRNEKVSTRIGGTKEEFIAGPGDMAQSNDKTKSDQDIWEEEKRASVQEEKSVTSFEAEPDMKPATNEVIMIDCENDKPKFLISVVEVNQDADENNILEELAQASGTQFSEAGDKPVLRRSGNRRKTRLPLGVIQSEERVEFDLTHNIAALRLILMEQCRLGNHYHPSHHLKLVVLPQQEQPDAKLLDAVDRAPTASPVTKPLSFDLPFSLNEKSLLDICNNELSASFAMLDYEDRVYIVRSDAVDVSGLTDDDIMINLFGVSSMNNSQPLPKNGKRKKQAKEKGFSGTFLSSVASVPASGTVPQKLVKSAMKDKKNYTPETTPGNLKRARFLDDSDFMSVDDAESSERNSHRENETDAESCDVAKSIPESTIEATSDQPGVVRNDAITRADDDLFDLVFRVTTNLLAVKRIDEQFQSDCVDAVQWVAERNPGNNESVILEQAFELFCDLRGISRT